MNRTFSLSATRLESQDLPRVSVCADVGRLPPRFDQDVGIWIGGVVVDGLTDPGELFALGVVDVLQAASVGEQQKNDGHREQR